MKRIAITDAISQFLAMIRKTPQPDGDLRPDGTLADHATHAVEHLKPVAAVWGKRPAEKISAKDLGILMTSLMDGSWFKESNSPYREGYRPEPFSACYVNKIRADVLRMFAWLELEGMVSPGKTEHLKVRRRFRQTPASRQIVSDDAIRATIRHASPTVAALIKLQRLTGCRPSEILRMRLCDIDDQGIYTPAAEDARGAHKTAYTGAVRRIPLNIQALEIVGTFMHQRAPDAYLFSPRESWNWYRARRESTRKTKLRPSEQRRVEAKKAAVREKPADRFHDRYDHRSYRMAVQYAIRRARAAGENVPDWSPYDVRHAVLTDVQYRCGAEESAALGGHSLTVNRVYAHRQHERALAVVQGLKVVFEDEAA